jgi:hypothetical protein
LGIQIHNQDAPTLRRSKVSEVAEQRRLSDSALVVDEG